jgi:uncharacterized protein (DUF58 family)
VTEPAVDIEVGARASLLARSPIPTPTGLIVLVTAASLGLLRPPGAPADLLFAGIVALLGVGYALAWRTGIERLVLLRRLPKVATKGDALKIVHVLLNSSGRLVRNVSVVERPGPLHGGALPAGSAGTFFAEILPGLRAEARTRLFLGRRGPLHLDGVTLAAGDPFGLFVAQRFVPVPGDVLVQPRPRRAEALASVAAEIRRAALEGGAGEWSRVREWRPGDPLRSVHWRLTARRGFPIVRTSDQPRGHATCLILDRRPGSGKRAAATFEQAVALTAGLGLALLEHGSVLSFLAPGDRQPVSLDRLRGRAGGQRLLEALARVSPDAVGLQALPTQRAISAATLVTSRAVGVPPELATKIAIVVQAQRLPSLQPKIIRCASAAGATR